MIMLLKYNQNKMSQSAHFIVLIKALIQIKNTTLNFQQWNNNAISFVLARLEYF